MHRYCQRALLLIAPTSSQARAGSGISNPILSDPLLQSPNSGTQPAALSEEALLFRLFKLPALRNLCLILILTSLGQPGFQTPKGVRKIL